MKVTRKLTQDAFGASWCPNCAKVTEMEPVRTGLPGIMAQKCTVCGNHYNANFFESDGDLMEVPDTFVFPTFGEDGGIV